MLPTAIPTAVAEIGDYTEPQRARTPTMQNYISSLYQNMLHRNDAAQEEEDLQAALMASLESYAQAEETNDDTPDED